MAGMLRTFLWLRAVALAALLSGSWAQGQASLTEESQSSSQTVTDVLHQMSDKADVIFAGQVLAVRLPKSGDAASGVVEVEFRVDQSIRGCAVGTPYILREWGGLWAGGDRRYRVGQRLLMVLHAPSTGGMSSPVGGLDGAIPIREGATEAALTDGSGGAAPPPFVDLRWLGARLPHTVSYRSGPERRTNRVLQTAFSQQTALAVTSGSKTTAAPILLPLGDASVSDASIPAQQASVDAVVGLLTEWQKARHVEP